MLELHLDKREAVDSVVPVRWCISKDTLEELKSRGAKDPHIFIATIYPDGREKRWLLPLGQVIEYIDFSRPGPCRIVASIVWENYGGKKELRRRCLDRSSHSRYRYYIIQGHDDQSFCPNLLDCKWLEATEIEVVVADGFFAKEPSEFEKKYVNWFFDYPAHDQCDFKKRRLIAYFGPQYVVMLGNFLVRALAASWFLLIGKRGINYKAVFQLLDREMDDVWLYRDYSVFTKDSKGEDRNPIVALFAPIVSLPTLVLFYFWSGAILTALIFTILAIVVVGGLIAFAVAVLPSIGDYFERLALERSKRYEEEAEDIICTGRPMPASLDALSKNKRTLYLRFKDLKAAVCRPYAA